MEDPVPASLGVRSQLQACFTEEQTETHGTCPSHGAVKDSTGQAAQGYDPNSAQKILAVGVDQSRAAWLYHWVTLEK